MKAVKQRTIFAATALAAATTLLLVGCSAGPTGDGVEDNGGTGGPPAEAFEFQSPVYGPETALTMRIPAALVEAVGSDSDGLLVNEVTANARELDSSKSCAVDLVIDYREGGLDTLTAPSMTKAEYAAQGEEELKAALMQQFGVETAEEAVASEPGAAAEVEEIVANLTQAPYVPIPAWSALDVTPADELDTSDPEPGRYISDDFKTLTFVQSCASDPLDDSSSNDLNFPIEYG